MPIPTPRAILSEIFRPLDDPAEPVSEPEEGRAMTGATDVLVEVRVLTESSGCSEGREERC